MQNAELRAAQAYFSGQAERSVKWKSLVKSDPRRAVRALTLTGFTAESVEGDTVWDAQHIMEALEDVSRNPKGEPWKRLVNAGLVDALCENVVKMGRVGMMQDPRAPRPSKEELERMQRELPSPWYHPLAIICSGLVNGSTSPTSTEQQIAEDLKKHWHSVTERVWTDPSNSLGPGPRAALERAVLGQIAVCLLTAVDPSFIESIIDPSDRTLSICMRNWLHADSRVDCNRNASVLLPFLAQGSPFYTPSSWRPYLAEHPMPSAKELLPRILEGASRIPGKSSKRRNPEQTAAAIVSASVQHLSLPDTELKMLELSLELDLLSALLDAAETTYPALPRAAYKSPDLWEAVVRGMRRAAGAKRRGEKDYDVVMMVVEMCAKAAKRAHAAGDMYVDRMVHGWAKAGVLDALEDAFDLYFDKPAGRLGLTLILNGLFVSIFKLSTKTVSALRAQLPRPHLLSRLRSATGDEEGDLLQIYGEDIRRVELGEGSPLVKSGLWNRAALELLQSLTTELVGSDQCARRGCAKPATGPPCKVAICKGTRYCSSDCLQRDKEHWEVCCDGEAKRIVEQNTAGLRQAQARRVRYCALTVALPVLAYAASTFLRSLA
ncbi:hypothetical protein C8Q77DRAFT_1088256 [Trametes polyzona]|nr:hypothetical protein C8Q77DRAFT_1088256 [Trametes polyzona]